MPNRETVTGSTAAPDGDSEELAARGWTDGLPIVPPTRERVLAMIEGSGLKPEEMLGFIGPRRGQATVEKVAANAVMAGCLPEFFPVLAAAVSAVADQTFQLDRIVPWSGPAAPMVVVHGPIRNTIGLNCGYDALGCGVRANATIGRALHLILMNIGGGRPGSVTKSPHGQPGRMGICFGEHEEASPWPPAHVDQGMAGDESAVTVYAVTGTAPIFYRVQRSQEDPEILLDTVAACLRYVEGYATTYHQDGGLPVLLLCPLHARILAEHGWDKDRVRKSLAQRVDFTPVFGAEARMNAPTCVLPGKADDRVTRLPVIVSGGVAGYHSTFLPTIVGVPPITRPVRNPGAR